MKDVRFAKFVLLVNGLVPGVLLLWDVARGHAGANPVNHAIRTTGLLTLIFLTLTLTVTPLRRIPGLRWLFHFRRSLGLLAFSYGLAHFAIFFIFDRALSVSSLLAEIVKRPYLIVGATGLLAMVPLAATSTNAMIRRLGPKRWHTLHRLVYLAAIAGVVHFYMLVKADTTRPIVFAAIVGALLGYRVVAFLWARREPMRIAVAAGLDEGRWHGILRVAQITRQTPDVRTFRLVAPEISDLPFTHLPGQYLTLSQMIGGKLAKRTYTIASPPTQRDHCEITVKREERGLVSRHLHDVAKEEDTWHIAAAAGQFTFVGTEADQVAMLAGGVGITPLMAMLRSLVDRQWPGQIYLIFSCKTERDIIFREELETLAQRCSNFHLTVTLTRAEGSDWSGARGRIDAQLLKQTIPNLTDIPFYLCGPGGMLNATRDLLGELGVAEANIHTESFGLDLSGVVTDGSVFTVKFERSGKTGEIDGARPLIQVADELEVGVDSECRSGMCGRCKCQMISGSVQMANQEALDNKDRRNNMILLCQARALQNVVVNA